jgi:putative spermidine/putrescine transport system permease protein
MNPEASGISSQGAHACAAAGESRVRWERLLIFPAVLSFCLLVLPQAGFVWLSLHEDVGFGQVGDRLTLRNYATILSDPFFLSSIWLTIRLSAVATLIGLALAFPTAYALSRIGGAVARIALGLVLTTSLITIVVKLMGLNIVLGASGLINVGLLHLHVITSPLALVHNETGVLIGLVQYVLPILILLLFGVAQTIPVALEEAAAIHGATQAATFARVLLPLAKPGLLAGGLIAFNMSMGAFTSAVLLGGGRVKTMPVLIQEKIIGSTDYAMGAALSTVLLVLVFAVNVAVSLLLTRMRRPSR